MFHILQLPRELFITYGWLTVSMSTACTEMRILWKNAGQVHCIFPKRNPLIERARIVAQIPPLEIQVYAVSLTLNVLPAEVRHINMLQYSISPGEETTRCWASLRTVYVSSKWQEYLHAILGKESLAPALTQILRLPDSRWKTGDCGILWALDLHLLLQSSNRLNRLEVMLEHDCYRRYLSDPMSRYLPDPTKVASGATLIIRFLEDAKYICSLDAPLPLVSNVKIDVTSVYLSRLAEGNLASITRTICDMLSIHRFDAIFLKSRDAGDFWILYTIFRDIFLMDISPMPEVFFKSGTAPTRRLWMARKKSELKSVAEVEPDEWQMYRESPDSDVIIIMDGAII